MAAYGTSPEEDKKTLSDLYDQLAAGEITEEQFDTIAKDLAIPIDVWNDFVDVKNKEVEASESDSESDKEKALAPKEAPDQDKKARSMKDFIEQMRSSPWWRGQFKGTEAEWNAHIDKKLAEFADEAKDIEDRISRLTPDQRSTLKKAEQAYSKAVEDQQKSKSSDFSSEMDKAYNDLRSAQEVLATPEERAAWDAKSAQEKLAANEQSKKDMKDFFVKGIAPQVALPLLIYGGSKILPSLAGKSAATAAISGGAASATTGLAEGTISKTAFDKIKDVAKNYGPLAALSYASTLGDSEGGGGIKEALFGKKFSNFTPEQQGIISKLGQLGVSGLESNKADFAPIENQARKNFSEKTVPSIAERFSNSGGSSAFGQQLGEAASGLETNLAALKAQHGLQQQGHFTQLAQLGITPKYPNATIKEGQDTSGLLGGLGSIATDKFGKKFAEWLG